MDIKPADALRALRRTLIGPDIPAIRPRSHRVVRYAGPVGVLVLAGLFAINVAYLTDPHRWPLPIGSAWLLSALTVAPLVALPWRPLLAWRLTVVALLLCTFNADPRAPWPWSPPLVLLAPLVLAVTALRADRGVLVWVGLISAAPVLVFVNGNNITGVLLLLAVLLALGHLIRRNRLSRSALVAQTELSELEKARRAVLEERTRIAREMHDVVAHHMSMIAVQAETAPYRLTGLPEDARTEFGAIAGSARHALTDMRRLLGVLRSESAEPRTAPQPGLADLTDLVDGARRAGMTVELTVARHPGPDSGTASDAGTGPDAGAAGPGDDAGTTGPGDAVGLAAYRIVQEALANAARHAPGKPVRVAVRVGRRDLDLHVDNPLGGPPDPGRPAGHGLIGMRERATLLGGGFTAGPADGRFTVTARLPYHHPEEEPPA
ncbi:sensor histidine kinase [Micromonospora zhanjiangensis]